MTTQLQRARWTTFNTWAKDRRKTKRASRRAHRELQQLLDQAPAALAAAQNRRTVMSHVYDDAEAERRQQARRDLIARCGNPPRRERPAPAPTEQDDRQAAGFIFSVRDEQIADAQAEHRLRRRRADRETEQRDHLWHALRDSEGSDYADQWFGGDAA